MAAPRSTRSFPIRLDVRSWLGLGLPASLAVLIAFLGLNPKGDGPSPGRPVATAAEPIAEPVVAASYTEKFDAELAKLGQITPAQFAARYPAPQYLDKPTWDPTEAKYWNAFQDEKPAPGKKYGQKVYKLDAAELAAYKANGFVVSERLGGQSFGEIFYQIYSRDLPVFISGDAILHAWHRSYDAMLEELEMTYLSAALDGRRSGRRPAPVRISGPRRSWVAGHAHRPIRTGAPRCGIVPEVADGSTSDSGPRSVPPPPGATDGSPRARRTATPSPPTVPARTGVDSPGAFAYFPLPPPPRSRRPHP